ncbi:putative leader peptide [Streptomyces polygonati]|uniref:Leader peptide n=1 Tax=Streptomyces polygonati TaxID=1617087 RepID=A0ABV8HG92_9ACTN
MRKRCSDSTFHPYGSFELHVVRRHVDLLRVSSALCPRPCPVR